MLEEWYTHANAPQTNHTYSLVNDVVSPKPTLLDIPIGDERDHRSEEVILSPKAQSTGDLNVRMSAVASDRGPYELLVKERMMGLYIAVFVHRDVRSLVEGWFLLQRYFYPVVNYFCRHLEISRDCRFDWWTIGEQGRCRR